MSYIRTQNAADETSTEIERTDDGVHVVAGGWGKAVVGSRSKSHFGI